MAVAFATLDLVFNLSDRARTHAFLRRQYFVIAAALERPRANAAKAQADMLKLAAEEEPPYLAAHALAENWATRAVLGPSVPLPCRVGWLRRRLRHFIRFDGQDFGVS